MLAVHLRLIGKLVGNFLLVIIELFFARCFRFVTIRARLTDRQNLDHNTVRMLRSRTVNRGVVGEMSEGGFNFSRIQSLISRGRCASWDIRHIFPAQISGASMNPCFSDIGDRATSNFGRIYIRRRCCQSLFNCQVRCFVSDELECVKVQN